MGSGERLMPLERAPDPHREARQLQLPGDHQTITTVMTGSDQHQHPLPRCDQTGPVRSRTRQQASTDGQGRLLHQRLHR